MSCTGGTVIEPTTIKFHTSVLGTLEIGPITWTEWGATSAHGTGSGASTSSYVTLSNPITYHGSRVFGGIQWSNFPTTGLPTWCGER